MKEIRLAQMEQYILEKDTVLMEELQDHFSMSLNTVRRDIVSLIKKGTVEKVYGGVRARKAEPLPPFDLRTIKHQEAKIAIGKKAAELVEDDDIIFLDSGTTTLHLIQNLAHKQNITIITHNLPAIMAAMPYPNLNVIVLPGRLQRRTSSLTGMEAIRMLSGYNMNKAFMAATGISSTHSVTNSSSFEYELKVTALERCEQSILLLDSHKFGQSALMTYASLEKFNYLITEAMPDARYQEALKAAGTKLLLGHV